MQYILLTKGYVQGSVDTFKIKTWTHLGSHHHSKARPPSCFFYEGDPYNLVPQTCKWQAKDVYQEEVESNLGESAEAL